MDKTKIILFQGDSITDAGRSREDNTILGYGYTTLVKGELGFEFPNQYKYSFCDDGERDIYLTITHLSDNSSGSASTSEYSLATVTDDMTSMMKKSASKTESVINRNGLEYYYSVKGELSRIAWCSDGIQYKINGQLHHRGVYNNSLFKRLISIDETEANAAFEEIKQALNSK